MSLTAGILVIVGVIVLVAIVLALLRLLVATRRRPPELGQRAHQKGHTGRVSDPSSGS
jgi:hypothetical protein